MPLHPETEFWDWIIKPRHNEKLKIKRSADKRKTINQLKYCEKCSTVWEYCEWQGRYHVYDHLPAYGLEKIDCFRCSKIHTKENK
jgi:hypothetical protein